MQTMQQMFDHVLFALRKQGIASVFIDDSFDDDSFEQCVYRDPTGNKCAAGHLIPDELYDPRMDRGDTAGGGTMANILRTFPAVARHLSADEAGSQDQQARAQMIFHLQLVHDGRMPRTADVDMSFWEEGMQNVAKTYSLVYTPPAA